jgi:hypothetical protein
MPTGLRIGSSTSCKDKNEENLTVASAALVFFMKAGILCLKASG